MKEILERIVTSLEGIEELLVVDDAREIFLQLFEVVHRLAELDIDADEAHGFIRDLHELWRASNEHIGQLTYINADRFIDLYNRLSRRNNHGIRTNPK